MNILKKITLVTATITACCTMLTGCPDKDLMAHSIDDEPPSSQLFPNVSAVGGQDKDIDEIPESIEVQFDISIDGEPAGSFVVTTDPENAPITCANFQTLVENGYYDGLSFHRVMDGFMAQGGQGVGMDTANIYGEFSSNGWENAHKHLRGTISMARATDPNSASSGFFICYVDYPPLDGEYAAFGDVTEGMEVVDSFLNVERTPNERGEIAVPTVPIIIEKATIIE